jgi:hypothetical protein
METLDIKLISAEFYVRQEEGRYIPTLIMETLENDVEVKRTYEMQRMITDLFGMSFGITNYILIFNDKKDIKIVISKIEREYTTKTDVWLYPRTELPIILSKTEDNRYLYGKVLEEYKSRTKDVDTKEVSNFEAKRVMDLLKIKPYNHEDKKDNS